MSSAAALVAGAASGCYLMHEGLESAAPANAGPQARDANAGTGAQGGLTTIDRGTGGSGGATSIVMDRVAQTPTCVRGGSCLDVAAGVTKLDMLFMIDNSDSMISKQTKLRAQLPHLIEVLMSGDVDGDGRRDQGSVIDVHVAVVSSDMGLPGVEGIANCRGLGDDGIFQHVPSKDVTGCQASYPTFLSFQVGAADGSQTEKDFACIAVIGTGGCGFESQLEASLKALWPSTDARVQFLADPTSGNGALGHGDRENKGFLRNDPADASAIAIILLTDEDDCSKADTHPFTPPMYLDPNDPLVKQGMNTRCHYNQQSLLPVMRYVNAFKALRPQNENLVIFAAITGVPADLVSADVLGKIDFASDDQRSQLYARILKDSRMQEVVDDRGTSDASDDRLEHSCNGANDMHADPPIRIVQVAQGFGANGIVQSICQDDYGRAINAVAARVGSKLGPGCLAHPIARADDGLIACDLLWHLPLASSALPGTPTKCAQAGAEFLRPRSRGLTVDEPGGAICQVVQLPVKVGLMTSVAPAAIGAMMFEDGWYYDDFSADVAQQCGANSAQHIAYTGPAQPPPDVRVTLDCAP